MASEQELVLEIGATLLREGKVLHLATQSNGQLWICHVWYAIGDGPRELIYTSNCARRHSKEIQGNPVVAGGVVPITLEGLGQKVQGVSFEGIAEEASGAEIERSYERYAQRWPQVRGMFSATDIATGATQMRMYTVSMTRLVVFDEVRFAKAPRQEVCF